MGCTGSNDFYNQFSRLLQGRFGGHKHLKVLVLKNQQQRWHKPTPNQQMQHFLHFKTDTHLNPQHKVQCNYIDVVYVYNIIINAYMLLAVFMHMLISLYLIAIEFHFLIYSNVPITAYAWSIPNKYYVLKCESYKPQN